MAYDDVAHSSENPFPREDLQQADGGGDAGGGRVRGVQAGLHQGGGDPRHVHGGGSPGTRRRPGGRKVLQSTAEDKVFVNFVDHGGVGIIAFPSGLMHATELQTTLKTMHSKKMYKELVFYMEACESGSMFDGFPTDLNIYVTTAANADESSWGRTAPPTTRWTGRSSTAAWGTCTA
eukprot:Sspe_Gene.149::Locus_49_Transcript_1_1_Confidence_1.000_Length_797::g.149::m.149/K01369/LGMN; legumain